MNLHWGKTLKNRWLNGRRKPSNKTREFLFVYNASLYNYEINPFKYYLDEYYNRGNSSYNRTVLHANNQFLKKSRMLTDLVNSTVTNHSFTTVVVIASIFLFVTMTVTGVVAVFCRKRNTVFSLQKSEQEDLDYELDEFNTDLDFTETEFESEADSARHRKSITSHVTIESDYDNSPARRPLVIAQQENEVEDSPERRPHVCRCGADPRGMYQRMVVTAVVEKSNQVVTNGSESDDSNHETRSKFLEKLNKKYYGFAALSSDIDSDYENYPMGKPPAINITYIDEPPSYDSIEHLPPDQHQIVADIETYSTPSANTMVESYHDPGASANTSYMVKPAGVMVHVVELPPLSEKPPYSEKPPIEDSVFVELPPKKPSCDFVTAESNDKFDIQSDITEDQSHDLQHCSQTITKQELPPSPNTSDSYADHKSFDEDVIVKDIGEDNPA